MCYKPERIPDHNAYPLALEREVRVIEEEVQQPVNVRFVHLQKLCVCVCSKHVM